MSQIAKPEIRPANPNFSTGPCAKHPGWSFQSLANAALGRSHRAKMPKAKLAEAIALTREVLQVPADYRIGIVPASDTGAVEMAMWSLLGARGADVAAWEAFGSTWVTDAVKELKLVDLRTFVTPYGKLPDLAAFDFDRDVVFTWNGTAAGVRIPDGDFIPADRKGLTICDATSAAFAQRLDFAKLDVVTYSWQKVLGGEAAHGMLILSPRAVERLETYKPSWPLPKIFRLTSGGKLIEDIFEGETINTPSMMCVEDYIDALNWVKSIGGLDAMIARADANAKVVNDFADNCGWLANLAEVKETRSNTSVCLVISDPDVLALDASGQAAFAKGIVAMLDRDGIAYDIGAYRDAPPGLRIWCGGTVEASDLEKLMPWLEWAYRTQKATLKAAA